ncbi:DUF6702 family protein [Bernardetia sp.]|uniref:DUF6702 family protein n=1 Tax=Bernardetia sp. TaxID=1937974 RepID=UPI0025C63E11|nr:DUF6702 family protein [Bernardetia sp.]
MKKIFHLPCFYQRLVFSFFIIFLFASFIPKHAMHLSITEMDFKEKGDITEIQISHKIFVDDLEKALRKNYKTVFEKDKPNLSTKTQHKEAEKYMYEYLKKVVDLKIKNQRKEINYIGVEFEGDVVWVYGTIQKSNSEDNETISIKNMILMDVFDDQRNMLYLYKKGVENNEQKEFLNFTLDNRIQTISF